MIQAEEIERIRRAYLIDGQSIRAIARPVSRSGQNTLTAYLNGSRPEFRSYWSLAGWSTVSQNTSIRLCSFTSPDGC